MFRRPDTLPYPLYVITTVFNSPRWRKRWSLYDDFAKRCKEAGAILYTCEIAYGDRRFVIEPPDGDPMRLLQLRTTHELWIKENALNLLMQRLPHDWEAVATIDADCEIVRNDWADEILHSLQRYLIVQPWSEAEDLTDECEHFQTHHSFVYSWLHGEPEPPDGGYYYGKPRKGKPFTWHPGFAWAYRRAAIQGLGGFIDHAILGSADMHMAKALIGRAASSMHPDIHGEYRESIMRWQRRADEHIKQNVGYVPGKLLHHWHGPKVARRYKSRWRILVDNHFDPLEDIKRDWQGLWQLSGNKPKLRDQLREYFSQREEDTPAPRKRSRVAV